MNLYMSENTRLTMKKSFFYVGATLLMIGFPVGAAAAIANVISVGIVGILVGGAGLFLMIGSGGPSDS